MPRQRRFLLLLLLVLFALAGCAAEDEPADQSPDSHDPGDPDSHDPGDPDSHDPGDPGDPDPIPSEPGEPVVLTPPAEATADLEAMLTWLEQAQQTPHEALASAYQVPHLASLDYLPTEAANLDLIQSSPLGLDADALQTLDANGFVISGRTAFPSFVYGYEAIYAHDLPLYVSADSIMHAVHRSYDDMLKTLEVSILTSELKQLLTGMRENLAAGALEGHPEQAARDADLYLTVALSLLQGAEAPVVAGADPSEARELFTLATEAEGSRQLELFGAARAMDFSQFTPRGHYTDGVELERYFRAMMWLGRVDLRLIETQPDLTQVFHRRQFEGAVALWQLLDADGLARWARIDHAIEAFVGLPDNMTVDELTALSADLGGVDPERLGGLGDDAIAQAIIDGGYGAQQIASHIMVNGVGDGTMPLNRSFLLFGQRYVVDSHVFSNVVYDRVAHGAVMRMMPDPLDVAFAALGNDHAFALLDDALRRYAYAGDLHSMRGLVDAHGAEFWQANLYNLWLSALRELSPGDALADPAAAGLPQVAATEAWGRRLLNTQLASWAELRHDTILYAKQSYTGGATCEFPDAYVDPYPEFYERVADIARHGHSLVSSLEFPNNSSTLDWFLAYFDHLETVAVELKGMAEHQRAGIPFTQAQMDFINEAVAIQWGCGDPAGVDGWYGRLFFAPWDAVNFDPTIADVHTQPTDEAGAPVGRVLHVGTGGPRLMVVTVDTCDGPRAYAGLASTYFERITEDYDRLDDIRWSTELNAATPADVPWMQDIVTR